MQSLPLAARVYIWVICVCGAALLGYVAPTNATDLTTVSAVAIFAAIMLLADLYPVWLPWGAVVTVAAAVEFAAVVIFGVGWACWAAAVAEGAAEIIHRKPWYKVAFNATGSAIWTGVAGFAYLAVSGGSPFSLDSITTLGGVAAYASVNFALNTLLLCLVIGFSQRVNPWQVWLANFRGISLQFATVFPIGVLIVTAYVQSPWGVLVVALPLVMVYYSFRASQELRQQTVNTIEYLADVVDKRDPYTFEHSKLVANYAQRIALRLDLPLDQVTAIVLAARVHDLGTIAIPDRILLKPGPLDPEERRIMQEHSALGAEMVGRLTLYRAGRDFILYHHERLDGTGYPAGLKGTEIPLGARILAVADSFQAMTSDRPYRKAMPLAKAIAELEAGRGSQFDAAIVDAFLAILKDDELQQSSEPATVSSIA